MQTIKIIKSGEYKEGEIVIVENNTAHRLIDSGQGVLYKNKMMSVDKKVSSIRKGNYGA
jgi:hypothetical protein